jgi:hypothetical protein
MSAPSREAIHAAPHFLGAAETLALGERLGFAMPRSVRIVAVEVADPFTMGTRMTAAVEGAVEEAADRVAGLVSELTASPDSASFRLQQPCDVHAPRANRG